MIRYKTEADPLQTFFLTKSSLFCLIKLSIFCQEMFWQQWLLFACGSDQWDLANDIALKHCDAADTCKLLYLKAVLLKHGAKHMTKVKTLSNNDIRGVS